MYADTTTSSTTSTNTKPKAYGAHRIPGMTDFGSLSDETLVDGRTAAVVLCCSYNQVFRLSRQGRLAKPIKTGPRSTRWKVGDLRAFIAASLTAESAAAA